RVEGAERCAQAGRVQTRCRTITNKADVGDKNEADFVKRVRRWWRRTKNSVAAATAAGNIDPEVRANHRVVIWHQEPKLSRNPVKRITQKMSQNEYFLVCSCGWSSPGGVFVRGDP